MAAPYYENGACRLYQEDARKLPQADESVHNGGEVIRQREPYWTNGVVVLHHGDVREVLSSMAVKRLGSTTLPLSQTMG